MNGFIKKYTVKMVSRENGIDSMDEDVYLTIYNNDGEQEVLRRAKYQNKKNKWRSRVEIVKVEENQTAYSHVKNWTPREDEGPSIWYHSPAISLRIQ